MGFWIADSFNIVRETILVWTKRVKTNGGQEYLDDIVVYDCWQWAFVVAELAVCVAFHGIWWQLTGEGACGLDI